MTALFIATTVTLILGMVFLVWHYEQELSKERREFMRIIDGLTNKIMHLAGRTWEQPPHEEWEAPVIPEYDWSPVPDVED